MEILSLGQNKYMTFIKNSKVVLERDIQNQKVFTVKFRLRTPSNVENSPIVSIYQTKQ